jgi:hypothetical protein
MTKSDKELKYFEYLIHKLKVFLEIIMGYIQGRFHHQTCPDTCPGSRYFIYKKNLRLYKKEVTT